MNRDINQYIKEINRLIQYDRSKTIFEQTKPQVGPQVNNGEISVGPITTKMDRGTVKTKRYTTDEGDVTGENFGYPDYCGSPEYAVVGTTENPAVKDWCLYRTPYGVRYFPYYAKVLEITNSGPKDMYEKFIYEYGHGNGEFEWTVPAENGKRETVKIKNLDDFFDVMGRLHGEYFEGTLRNSFYDWVYRHFPNGVVEKISIGGKKYGVNIITKPYRNVVSSSDEGYNAFGLDWGFNGYQTKNNELYEPPDLETVANGWDIFWYEAHKLGDEVASTVSSLACGENSLFMEMFGMEPGEQVGLLKSIGLEYGYDEFFCDVLAGLLMMSCPTCSFTIELLHAYDLYKNKDDSFGAVLSLTIGLIPLFGDAAALSLKNVARKLGKTAFTKAIKTLSLYIKFLSGEVKATVVWDAFKNLTKNERQLVFDFYATSMELFKKSEGFKSTIDDALLKLKDLNLGLTGDAKMVEESLKAASEILQKTSTVRGIINIGAQIGGIFTAVFGASVIKSLGFDPEDKSIEEAEEIFKALLKEEENGKDLFNIIAGSPNKPKNDEEVIDRFEKDYPCVLNHPNAKKIIYQRRVNDSSVEREGQVAYDINGDIYFYDGLRKLKVEPDIRLTEYNCDSSVFNDN